MSEPRRICVYCSSSNAVAEVHRLAAAQLGAAIGARGDTLVWGGASVGCMGELARAVRLAGGRTEGIIPEAMVPREIADTASDELVITTDMSARKAEMADRADAFVALPGGFGTLEELLEQVTLRQLGYHRKPVVLVDVDGFWQPLLAVFDGLVAGQFARPESRSAYLVVGDADEAMAAVDAALDPAVVAAAPPGTWL